MRPLPLLLTLGVLGTLVGGWWMFAADPDLLPAPAAQVEPTDAALPGDADPVATDAAARVEPVAADDASAVDADGEAEDGQRTAAVLEQRRSPKVLVVRGDPPIPVADAVVSFLTEPDANRRLGSNPRELTRWEWPEAFGQRATTGPDGIASLPVGDAPWLCSAAAGEDFGFAIVPPRDRTQTIVLQPDETVALLARTADAAPAAGVPLAILQQFGGEEGRVVWQRHSDRGGRAVARHFQLLRENRGPKAPAERFATLAAVPNATAVEFAGRPAPRDEIHLLVPPLGSLRIQLVDHVGAPILSRATIGLTGWTPPTFAAPSEFVLPGHVAARRAEKPPGSDPVVMPWQQVGAPLRVFARYALDRRPAEAGPVAGPAEPGACVDCVLPLRDTQAVVAGRFVLAEGTPLAGGRVEGSLWNHEREVWQIGIDAVADGRFDLVAGQRPEPEFWLELRFDLRSAPAAIQHLYDAEALPRLGARVRVPALRGRSRLELGTIELAPLPTLVSGLVVDDEGQPVADADVHVQQEEPAAPERSRDPWRTLSMFRTRSGADGRFLIEGTKPPGNLRVRADTDKHFADSVPLHTQGQDVRIRIDRNGILRGRVLLPDWLADGTASLQLRPFDESLRQRDTRSVDLSRRGGGRFTIEPLRPGRFDAIVLVRNLPEPLAIVQDVFVQPGETRDARLRPLDLRAALYRYRLRALDGAGQPLPIDGPILARFAKNDGTFAEAGFRWQKGRAELITGSPTAEMVFFGRGHQTVRMLLGAGDSDVRLPATRPALVELPGLRALCGPARKVRISVILQGDTGLPGALGGVDQRTGERFGFQRWDLGRSSGAWLGASDTVEVPLLQSGKYEILLRPHATDTERSPQGQVSLGVHELQVDSASWLPVRVTVDPIRVSQMLQQLDQQWAQAQQQGANRQPGQTRGNRGR